MRFYEAMKLLEEGKKVRNTIWPSGSWICKTENGDMTGETNNTFLLANINGNWEEYIESTDNTAEKIEEINPNNYLTFVDYDKDGNEEYKLDANLAIMGDCSRGIKGIISKLNEVINKVNAQTVVVLAHQKDIEEIKNDLDY